jgi:dienelactone hydrolase
MHARERRYHARDNNRIVRPFAWGLEFITEHVNGDDPRLVLRSFSEQAMRNSDEFYALPPRNDFTIDRDYLSWTSAIQTPDPENNIARARYFPVAPKKSSHARSAVVVLPQWNAQPDSHVEACRIFNYLGISALRLTLPFHEDRRPPELQRADHLVSANIGRTVQSMRQAVLDTRAAVQWLRETGYERIGILGTSIGSCIAFLAFCHDPAIEVGVFNHVSGYVADVVWQGISTQHVRAGIADHVSLDELREFWKPISPVPFVPRLLNMKSRPMRFIAARYDLTFPVEMSRQIIADVRNLGLDLDVVWLPCGHYSLAEMPWKALDAWKIATFFRKHLRSKQQLSLQ